MNRRHFLTGSLALATAAYNIPFAKRGVPFVRNAHAAPGGLVPYPVLAIMLRGGLDPAMHLVATPNGSHGSVVIQNRMSGTVGIRETAAGIRYYAPTITPAGATDFEPHLADVALLRAFRAKGTHSNVSNMWFRDDGSYEFSRMPWAAYLAASHRAAGAVVSKPCAFAYRAPDPESVANEPYLDFSSYGTQSPNPATVPERILSITGFFDSIAASTLPPFERQAPAYALARELDSITYSRLTQPEIVSHFGAATANADAVLKTLSGGPAWPPPKNVLDTFAIDAGGGEDVLAYDPPYERMFALAYQAFSRNVSHVIGFVNHGLSVTTWDSHYRNHDLQVANGNLLWPALGKLIALMKITPSPIVPGKTLFETTNIWIQSEMGRTPGPDVPDGITDTSDGTAHWPTASATFIGGRFRRGRAIGGIGDDWYDMPVNPSTGNAAGGSTMTMENVIATVIKASGADPSGYTNAPPIDALLDMTS